MTKETIDRVIELLAQQRRFNVIARECGISKAEVRKVALGRRMENCRNGERVGG